MSWCNGKTLSQKNHFESVIFNVLLLVLGSWLLSIASSQNLNGNSPLFCFVGTRSTFADAKNNIIPRTQRCWSFSWEASKNMSCASFNITRTTRDALSGKIKNSKLEHGECIPWNLLSNRTCLAIQQEYNLTNVDGCKRNICDEVNCNKFPHPAHCPFPPNNDLQLFPQCTMREVIPLVIDDIKPVLSEYPYLQTSKCKNKSEESFQLLRHSALQCFNGTCPMWFEKVTGFADVNFTRMRFDLSTNLTKLDFLLSYLRINRVQFYDVMCLSKNRDSYIYNLTSKLENLPVYNGSLSPICKDAFLRDVKSSGIRTLARLLNATTHEQICKVSEEFFSYVKSSWSSNCNKSGLIAYGTFILPFVPVAEIETMADFLVNFFLNWNLPTCQGVQSMHIFDFEQYLLPNLKNRSVNLSASSLNWSQISRSLADAFRGGSSDVLQVSLTNLQPSISKIRYRVYVNSSSLTRDSLMQNYDTYQSTATKSALRKIAELVWPPFPPLCKKSTVQGFSFFAAVQNGFSYSKKKCAKGNSQASIRCVPVKEKTDEGLFFTTKFDAATLNKLDCELSLSQIQGSFDATQNIASVLRKLQLYTNIPLSPRESEQTFQILDGVHQSLQTTAEKISVDSVANILAICSNLVRSFKSSNVPESGTAAANRLKLVGLIDAASRKMIISPNGISLVTTKEIILQVSRLNPGANTSMYFAPVVLNEKDSSKPFSRPVIIRIPSSALNHVMGQIQSSELTFSGENDRRPEDDYRAAFVLYHGAWLFPSQKHVKRVVSANIGTTQRFTAVNNLPEAVQIIHSGEETHHGERQDVPSNKLKKSYVKQRCVYWDEQLSEWSSRGCRLFVDQELPTCKCDHLTSFALIVSRLQLPADLALSTVSYIGCSVSAVALLITIVLIAMNKETRKKASIQIQLHVNSCLFVAYVLFLTGVSWSSNDWGCTVITALLQFFFLSAWLWMGIYSNKLYNSIVKVFSVSPEHYVLKASALGYGLPLLVVVINASVTILHVDRSRLNYDYSPPQLDPDSSSYRPDHMCWVHRNSLYFGFLLLIGLVLVNNIVVMILVVRRVASGTGKIQSTAKDVSTTQQIKMSCILAVTLGVTWLIGFFMMVSDDLIYNLVLSWVFSILSGFQGLMVFYVTAVQRKDIFQMWYTPLRRFIRRREPEQISDQSNLNLRTNGERSVNGISVETKT